VSRNIYEGIVCVLEQDNIKEVVNKIQEELPLAMNIGCWEKLQDFIFFQSAERKILPQWSNFLDFAKSHSETIINTDILDNIVNGLEKKGINELIIDEMFCKDIGIPLNLIKNMFIETIVDPIRITLSEWNKSTTKQNNELGENFHDEWNFLYNELKGKIKLFLNSLWEEVVDQIVISHQNFDHILGLSLNTVEICYDFDV